MQEEPIFGNSGTKIILIDKKEYYLIYEHDNIPLLTEEKYQNIIKNKEPDINLGTILLYDKQKTKDGKYIKISPKYKSKNKQEDRIYEMDIDMEDENENKQNDINSEQKEGILMTDAINLNLLESDFMLLYKVMMILEGRNSSNLLEKTPFYYNFPYLNNKNNVSQNGNKPDKNTKKTNDVLKIDMNEKKLKIISIVNKGINMILFSIDINVEYIPDLSELLDMSMKIFKNKARIIKTIDKSFNSNLKTIDELNLKKTTLTRINKEKNEKLMTFIVSELNKKKKNNYLLNDKINSLFTAPVEDKKKNGNLEEDKDEDKELDISLGSIVPEEDNDKDKDKDNNNNKGDNKENNDIVTHNKDDKGDNNNSNNNNAIKEENMNNNGLDDSNLSLTDL